MPQNTFSALLIPLAVLGGWAAGALSARTTVRRELEKLRPAPAPPQARPAVPPTAVAPEPPTDGLNDEMIAVLTATVAAFLGKKARIRRARLVSPMTHSSAWAQQGRVYVQASHNLGAMQRS
jgi:methylmalonyl-CoA carboxyltransferase large subunit